MTRPQQFKADVVIVGGGPAGLSAAVAAASHGRSVLVLDQGIRAGGQIWRHRDTSTLPAVAQRLLAQASAAATIVNGARVIDAVNPQRLLAEVPGGVAAIRAGVVILATGAKERFTPFPGWTLPGVVGIGGLQALIKSGVEMRGARLVISGTGPLLFPVAATAVHAGAHVLLVAEHAERAAVMRFAASLWRKPPAMGQAIRYRWGFRRTRLRFGSWPLRAIGDTRVRAVTMQIGARVEEFGCDWLAAATGLVPSTELGQLLGCALDHAGIIVDSHQRTSVPSVWAAGECTGVKGDAAGIAEGAIAGHAAAGAVVFPVALGRARTAGLAFAERLRGTFAPRTELATLADPDTIVCRCEDVRRSEIDPAWSQRQAKLWTRVGMGECQGNVCGPACEALFGWDLNAARAPIGAPTCQQWMTALDAAGENDRSA